ncbi:LysR family transcriptional regulator [Methylobacterium platani]|uniref:LysR family transcriptional regulator n=1 Tax=Methylobacterium platani TaxID=427683 RepID=A0A179RZ91_9HYPH|nr:LysR family transcriptional regulator [Methylobacterium platani]OAS17291.1 LysR family transcriptional regulator [Methylobacterium platani]
MDLDDLHIFRSVVREGGVTRAAERLNRVPSNVTTRIKQFEERLGIALFRREGRSLTLTEAGRTLLGHADKLLHLADLAERELRGGGVRGTLRLGSLESAAGARLPPILSAFHARYPDVTIELQTGTTRAMLRQLERHEVEAAFVSEPFERGALSSVPAFDEELVLITALGAAESARTRTVVAFPHGCSYRQRLFAWLAEEGRSPERILEMSSYHAIVACVAAGTGAALVPAEVLDHAVLGRTVARHTLPAHLRRNRTHLVWPDAASPPLRALMALLPPAEGEPGAGA